MLDLLVSSRIELHENNRSRLDLNLARVLAHPVVRVRALSVAILAAAIGSFSVSSEFPSYVRRDCADRRGRQLAPSSIVSAAHREASGACQWRWQGRRFCRCTNGRRRDDDGRAGHRRWRRRRRRRRRPKVGGGATRQAFLVPLLAPTPALKLSFNSSSSLRPRYPNAASLRPAQDSTRIRDASRRRVDHSRQLDCAARKHKRSPSEIRRLSRGKRET